MLSTGALRAKQLLSAPSIGRTSHVFKSNAIRPIIDKQELDSIDSTDPRHYQHIKAPDGSESNAMTYNPRWHKFYKKVMQNADANLARKLMDGAFFNIKLEQVGKLNKMKKEGQVPSDNEEIVTDPMRVFLTALDNCRPLLKVTPIKKGGISYQVPVPMSETEREFRARKIIIKSAKDKDNHVRFPKQLAYELLAASKNEGKSVKVKVDLHKLAEANRAYAQYRWK